jgi:hypothetical protein
MPKRFTVTEKWNDEWFMKLTPQAKVLWEYIRDNCDISGVFEINLELMRFRIRFSPSVDIMKHLDEMNEVSKELDIEDRIEWFGDRKRVWIMNFIRVQYGILSEKSSTHRGVMKVIDSHKLTKGLPKGYQTLIGTLKVKTKVKDKNKYNSDTVLKEPNISFETFWNLYDKKVGDRQKCVKKWEHLKDDERTAIMSFLPKYKISQPIKQYRSNPETFLNGRMWENEIIQPVNETPAPQFATLPARLKKIGA